MSRGQCAEAVVWQQALESLLNNYRTRHAQCVSGAAMPGKYMLMSMADDYAGLGNQFPSIVTGDSSDRIPATPCSTVLCAQQTDLAGFLCAKHPCLPPPWHHQVAAGSCDIEPHRVSCEGTYEITGA